MRLDQILLTLRAPDHETSGNTRDARVVRPLLKAASMGSSSFVRVLGIRRARYVEFSFAIGDRDLAVELVLPYAAFVELCQRHDAEQIPPEPDVARALSELARQHQRSQS